MSKCIIVCNGDIKDYELYKNMFDEDSFVICADGGTRHLREIGIFPDIIMGDMDSSSPEDLEYFRSLGTDIRKYPAEKDYTDTELAFQEAINMGFRDVKFLSCTGQRLDHTLANIFLLEKAVENGIECCIENENNKIFMLNGYVNNKVFTNEKDFKISLLPVSLVCKGVSITGVKYPLNDARITMGEAIGISNEFTGESAHVTIKEGTILVILSKD